MLSGFDLDRVVSAHARARDLIAYDPPSGFRVLACGGRDYFDQRHVFGVLDRLHGERPIALIIHGAAAGADTLAGNWAVARGVEQTGDRYKIKKEDWRLLGLKAGPMRNQRMLDEGKPALVVVFPGGRGTANMMKLAQVAGVPLMVVGYASQPKA